MTSLWRAMFWCCVWIVTAEGVVHTVQCTVYIHIGNDFTLEGFVLVMCWVGGVWCCVCICISGMTSLWMAKVSWFELEPYGAAWCIYIYIGDEFTLEGYVLVLCMNRYYIGCGAHCTMYSVHTYREWLHSGGLCSGVVYESILHRVWCTLYNVQSTYI